MPSCRSFVRAVASAVTSRSVVPAASTSPGATPEVPSFTVNDVDELQRAVGAGNDVALYTLGVALVRTRADTNRRGVQLVGGTAAIQAMRSLTMERGRFYTPEEGRSAAPVVV